jgi:hypothetical protein
LLIFCAKTRLGDKTFLFSVGWIVVIITEDMIRLKAYELWEASGKPADSAEDNWFAAKELLKKNSQTNSVKNQSPPIGLRQLASH